MPTGRVGTANVKYANRPALCQLLPRYRLEHRVDRRVVIHLAEGYPLRESQCLACAIWLVA